MNNQNLFQQKAREQLKINIGNEFNIDAKQCYKYIVETYHYKLHEVPRLKMGSFLGFLVGGNDGSN